MGIITCKAASGVIEPHQSRPLDKQTRTPLILDDYAEHFPPPLSPKHIFKVKKELHANLQDDERILLDHCLTLIRTESGGEQWNNAMVTVLGSERQIELSTGLSKNKYEVWMESGNPCYKQTEKEKPVVPEDYSLRISPPMTSSAIQKVQKDLGETVDDEERKLLQYCRTMIANQTDKSGRRQWNDVAITITSGRGRKIVIATGDSTTNAYDIWMDDDDKTPRYRNTGEGWAETIIGGVNAITEGKSVLQAIKSSVT